MCAACRMQQCSTAAPQRKLLTFETVLSQLSQLWPAPPHAARSVVAPLAPFVATGAPRDHARRSIARTRRRPARLRRPTAHAERRCRALCSFMPQGMQRCKPHIHSRHCARRRTHARAVLPTLRTAAAAVVWAVPSRVRSSLSIRAPSASTCAGRRCKYSRKYSRPASASRRSSRIGCEVARLASGCAMVTLARA